MKRFFTVIIVCVMVMSCLCSCSDKPVSLEKENAHNKHTSQVFEEKSEVKSEEKAGETLAEEPEEKNKYIDVSRILSAYDDVIIFVTHRGTCGLMSTDGEIICSNIITTESCANFDFDNNYMCCGTGHGWGTDVQTVIDKKGNTVLSIGKDNVEFISEITQGRILVYQMTDERPSGKTYDLICYSAKDMSEVFRISGPSEILRYIGFDETGYVDAYAYSDNICFDIHGNIYRGENNRYYDSNGKEYTERWGLGYDPAVSEIYGLPEVDGIEPIVNLDYWRDLANLYDEYKNSPDKEFEVGTTKNAHGQIATLYMNSTSEWCATMDSSGNVLMPATKDIMMRYHKTSSYVVPYTFSHDLCCAFSTQEQKWGYVDPYGNWKIAPQYDSVNTFSYDGYAVVDRYKVIDTQGETVLDISNTSDLTSLEGTFSFKSTDMWGKLHTTTITFHDDGTISNYQLEGSYRLSGNEIIFSGGWYTGDAYKNGINYSFQINGKNLVINGIEWIYQPENTDILTQMN